MSNADPAENLEAQIDSWRNYVRRRETIHSSDVAELEDHLREQIEALTAAGLAGDEAFLIAVKRLGALDDLSREFAREHSERLWKQLVVPPADGVRSTDTARRDAMVAFGLAVAAGVMIKLPTLFGLPLGIQSTEGFYFRNMALFVLPLLAGYFVWKRGTAMHSVRWLVLGLAGAVVFANVYPFGPGVVESFSYTEALTALHLPIALWILVGVAYAGGRWSQVNARMDFIRFSGEMFIYYVLIALGGGVLMGFTAGIFQIIGIDLENIIGTWIIPCGAMGGFLVAAWLVETKQSVIENMAPVLARLFTPLFTIVLLVFLGIVFGTGRGLDIERELLIVFDLLLAVVLGLLLYSISARDPDAPPGVFDTVQVVLVISALLANTVALWAIAGRITEGGFTPNRVAALGENLVLLVNLAWSAVLYVRFIRGRTTFAALERWQTNYLPVYGAWAAAVVILFPPLFGFI